jgi:UDPglucose 6-dehydrogenase
MCSVSCHKSWSWQFGSWWRKSRALAYLLTDWKEFAEIDLPELNRAVRFPIVIDGRNLYKPQQMADHGFTYVSIGRPANYNAQQGKPRKILL